MPYNRRTGRFRRTARRRPRRTRGTRVGATVGRTRFTYGKRVAQNLTRSVQYFKGVYPIASDNTGIINFTVGTDIASTLDQFTTYGTLYNEFKVMKVTVRYYPSAVGSESIQTGTGLPLMRRGDTVSYVTSDPTPPPTDISDVMGYSSARLINSRRPYRRYVNRAPGHPTWAELDSIGGVTVPDTWNPQVHLYGSGFTPIQAPGPQQYFFAMVTVKVLFRSRQE